MFSLTQPPRLSWLMTKLVRKDVVGRLQPNNMLPFFTAFDAPNSAFADSVLLSYLLSDAAVIPYGDRYFICDFVERMTFSGSSWDPGNPIFPNHILRVVLSISEPKVIWINAAWVIARMTNKSIIFYRALKKLVRKAMSFFSLPPIFEKAVPEFVFVPSPFPTRFCFPDGRHEFFDRVFCSADRNPDRGVTISAARA